MDSVAKNKSVMQAMQPKTMAELLPELSGIISKDSMQTLTGSKQPRSTMALTRTAVKSIKPLTMAEMRAEILALRAPSPRKFAQTNASAKKKKWNSSVKVENKTKSRTSQGQLKHNPVRKGLTFLPKPMEPITPETSKFPKPKLIAKKSLHLQATSSVRISGVCKIPETPVVENVPVKNQMTLANTKNFACQVNINRKPQITPPLSKMHIVPLIPDTPLANMSWETGSDTSFLQREKDVQDTSISKTNVLTQEQTPEKIAEVSPLVSTPFKEYRNIQEFFNHSEDTDNSALYHDNTIMSFDNVPKTKEKAEENMIVNLCDLLKKTSVVNATEPKSKLDNAMEVKKELEDNINMVEKGIKILTNIKESQLKLLHYIERLTIEKTSQNPVYNEGNITLTEVKSIPEIIINSDKANEISPITSIPCYITKPKSVSYKIPKRSPCLRKKILHKSVPNVSEIAQTPNKHMGKKAFSKYMEMKMNHQMNFLKTPCVKGERAGVLDTPALTSRNLQMQLDKIYKDDT